MLTCGSVARSGVIAVLIVLAFEVFWARCLVCWAQARRRARLVRRIAILLPDGPQLTSGGAHHPDVAAAALVALETGPAAAAAAAAEGAPPPAGTLRLTRYTLRPMGGHGGDSATAAASRRFPVAFGDRQVRARSARSGRSAHPPARFLCL